MSEWRDIDFRPGHPGWRAVFVWPDDKDGHATEHVVGWLVQEEGESEVDEGERSRRIVAAVMGGEDPASPQAVNDYGDTFDDWQAFWYLFGPGDDGPTAEDIATHRAELVESRDRTREYRAKKAREIAPKALEILMRHGPASVEAVARWLHIGDRVALEACTLLREQGQVALDRETYKFAATGTETPVA